MDWEAWARRAERAIDVAGRGDWKGLFAGGAVFSDPSTQATGDLGAVARGTRDIFPDWTQEITRIRGGDDWAVFEWIGRATYAPASGVPAIGIVMHGATIVEVDGEGLVTSWRDYLDRKEPEEQIRAALRTPG
jgi:hypothetical protein